MSFFTGRGRCRCTTDLRSQSRAVKGRMHSHGTQHGAGESANEMIACKRNMLGIDRSGRIGSARKRRERDAFTCSEVGFSGPGFALLRRLVG